MRSVLRFFWRGLYCFLRMTMTRPTIIMAAPNGARKVKTDHPAVPVTIAETIATAKECHAAGASIL
ncbi:MAG: 3-keto-5-aminohexanoate cleavage protein, partial [Candidatus Puniceispirillum sp.]